jgi:hypothetical protein
MVSRKTQLISTRIDYKGVVLHLRWKHKSAVFAVLPAPRVVHERGQTREGLFLREAGAHVLWLLP